MRMHEAASRLHVAEVLQEVGQAQLGVAQHNARLMCVKHVDQEQAEVTLQPGDVALSSMQNLHHLRKPMRSQCFKLMLVTLSNSDT